MKESPRAPTSHPPLTLGKFLREAGISIAIGIGVSLVMLIGAPKWFGIRFFLFAALVGFCIYLSCLTLDRLLEPWLARNGLSPKLASILAFFVGGSVGWLAAVWIGKATSLIGLPFQDLAVADVVGKGIGASLVMASVKAMLPLIAVGRSAEETLRELNRKLCEELSAREFVALAYACYNSAEATLELANAGLPDPYLLRPGAKPLPLVVPGPRLPLGLRDSIPYQSVRVSLEPGDRVLLLTDGLPEAPTAVGEPLGYEALAALLPMDTHPPGRSLDELLERVRGATSATLEDDWTVLLLEHSRTARSLRAVGADPDA